MNPQEFDALLSAGTGFDSQNQMVNSGINNQITQQTLQNVQALQTNVPLGSVPAPPINPAMAEIAQNAENQFFVLLNNEQKGPFTLEQIKGLAIADIITPESLVWRQGTPSWVDLKTCLASLGQ